MDSRHPTAVLLRLWLDGRLDHGSFLQAVLPYLTSSCSDGCLMEPVEARQELTQDGALRAAIDQVLEVKGALVREPREEDFREQLVALLALPEGERISAVEGSEARYAGRQLATSLLERSRAAATRDAEESESLSVLAGAVSRKVQNRSTSRAVGFDLEALALALQGNARRLLGEYREARGLFERSRGSLDLGSGDLVARGEILSLESSLLMDLRQFREARRKARRAVRFFRLCEEDHKAGRTLITLSLIYSLEGRSEHAVNALREAQEALDFAVEPHLQFYVSVNLALYVAESGDPHRGQEILRTVTCTGQSRRTRLACDRVGARIQALLGETAKAASRLAALRDEYAGLGDAPNTAMVSLDLAMLYAEQGLPRKVQEVTHETLPLLQRMAIPQEIWATLLLFKQAADAEKAGLEVLQGIRDTVADPRSWRGRVVRN